MSNAIILHRKHSKEEYYSDTHPSPSNSHWLPWLQKQLLMRDIAAQTPEMPKPYEPKYEAWREEFERYNITNDTVLVGHSCGGGFLVRWLSETKTSVGRVVLVAPSLGLNWQDKSFFDFTIDPAIAQRTPRLTIFGSSDDKPATLQAIELYRKTIQDIQFREFSGYGHFTLKHMRTHTFPELLQALVE